MHLEKFKNLPIAFDADGVILDFIAAFERAACEAAGRKVSSLGGSYSLTVKFGITEAELKKTWELFNGGDYWNNLEALPGAIEAIDKLQTAGFRNIHVVTAIPDEYRADRHANFRKLGFSPEAIHCVLHTTRFSKVPPIMSLRPFMFVDDRIEHLHSNQQVPLLVHIDHGDEQFPDHASRVDTTVRSLGEWADDFLLRAEHWAQIASGNNIQLGSAALDTSAPPTPARRRSPK